MIEYKEISKSYGNQDIIKNLNLKIEDGTFLTVVGTSGSGKTTLLKMINGLVKPNQGQILINGQDVQDTDLIELRRKIGYSIQGNGLFPHLTVAENIAFVLRVTGAKSAEIREKVNRVLDLVGLKGRANELPTKLSGGEQQRVAIARALVNQPVLLIADEPTGNLDPVTSEDIMKLFNEINHMGTTIIMVTHNKELVNSMHKRVVSIEEGHIISDVKKGGYDLHV